MHEGLLQRFHGGFVKNLQKVCFYLQFQLVFSFQFIGTNNFVSANIFIVGDNIIVVSCMYLTLFACTLKGTFNCHQLLALKYWHWQLFQIQYYILLAPTTISDTILFQLIIAKLLSQKVCFGDLVRIYTCIMLGLVGTCSQYGGNHW